MINIIHKLRLTIKQEVYLDECLFSAVGIENWVIGQIKHRIDEKSGIPLRFLKPEQLRSILSKQIEGHSKKCGLSSKLINDCINAVIISFQKARKDFQKEKAKAEEKAKKTGKKKHIRKAARLKSPIDLLHFKTIRKKNSFYFKGDIKIVDNRLKLPGLKTTIKMSESGKFIGKLKKVTLIKKFDGWHASCCYDQDRKLIEITDGKEAGIDPGLKTALVFSDGKKIEFPKFYQEKQELIKKQQRKSKNSKKLKRTQAKIATKRRDHHHKTTTDLSKEYTKIYWSDDNFKGLVQMFGKQYSNYAFGMFRDLLEHKLASREDGFGKLIKVCNNKSTMTCSACGAESGPTGVDGLEVREWVCSVCGAVHDRDVNAAMNTYNWGKAMSSNKGNHVSRGNCSGGAGELREPRATHAVNAGEKLNKYIILLY